MRVLFYVHDIGAGRHDRGMDLHSRLAQIYQRVRNLPYDTVAAHDAEGLRSQGRGNCVARAGLLAVEPSAWGVSCRVVSWEYELPVLVDVQHELGFTSDVHTAVQVRDGDRWLVVDATYDPALADLGLTVGQWDGTSETEPAYPAIGPVAVLDHHGHSSRLGEAVARIGRQVEATPPDLIARYQHDLNELFDGARSSAFTAEKLVAHEFWE